jgi:bacterioferritin-associated ferredoxin
MPNNPLFYPVNQVSRTFTVRDQIQMALAIADETLLKSLLVNCIPAIAKLHQIGRVASQVGVPTENQQAADGILQVEVIRCVLADPPPKLEAVASNGGWNRESKELARLTQHESELQTLVQNLPLAPAISLLANAGFQPEPIQEILRLPNYAWHKSWWYTLDAEGQFTLPFLRCIRTLRYPDGTLTFQYKDFFEQEKPGCFTFQSQKILIGIRSEIQGFGETLQQLNYQREALNIQPTILICDTISELEAQAFISQGISVYPAMELVLPIQSDCQRCARRECPMNGLVDSPVAACYGFLVQSEFV